MKATEALDEIRKAREEIARRYNFDLRKLVDFYLKRQKEKLEAIMQEKQKDQGKYISPDLDHNNTQLFNRNEWINYPYLAVIILQFSGYGCITLALSS